MMRFTIYILFFTLSINCLHIFGQCQRCVELTDFYQDIETSMIPPKIQENFTNLFPEIQHVKWRKCSANATFETIHHQKENQSFYAEFEKNNQQLIAIFDATTQDWIAVQTRILTNGSPSRSIFSKEILRKVKKHEYFKGTKLPSTINNYNTGICDYFQLKVNTNHELYQKLNQQNFYLVNYDAVLLVYDENGKFLLEDVW